MSKTKGNTIDPLVINDKYGTDAVRFALLISAAPGNDIALSEDRIASCRNFANKIWNASRLLFSKPKEGAGTPVSLADRWIAGRIDIAARMVNPYFESHRYNEAAQALWHLFWDDFCDWYLELKKQDTDWSYAYIAYEKALRLLHPLMPFLTEELWHRLEKPGKSIAFEPYPQGGETDHQAAAEMMRIQAVIIEIRKNRASNKIDKSQPLDVTLEACGWEYDFYSANIGMLERLGNVTVTVTHAPKTEGMFHMKLNIPVDRARLERENAELEKVIANSRRQLDNADVIAKMPEKVVETLRSKLAGYEAQLKKNKDLLNGE